MKETQQSVNEAGYVGLVWWIPNQFWEVAAERAGMSPETAKERYAPLRKYTLIVVAVGKAGIANIDYISEPVIRDATTLRDSDGTVYRPVQKVSGDADGLLALMKVMFGKTMGPLGQNIQMLFFPATNRWPSPSQILYRPAASQ
jgi:hypothetical protein